MFLVTAHTNHLLALSFYSNMAYSLELLCTTLRVSEDMPLYDILNEFQKGHSHIAVVYRGSKETTLQKTKEGTKN